MSRWYYGLSIAALAAVLGSTAAYSADLPTKKEAPAPAVYTPLYNWTGFYIGANLGGIFGTGSTSVGAYPAADALYFPNSLGNGPSGWLGGGQVGYNYQVGQGVFGVETDLDWTSLSHSGSYTSGALPGGTTTLTTTGSARMDWLGTLRLRAGFAATADNRLLIYGTGGLAYGGGSTWGSVVANGTPLSWYGSNNPTRTGWTIGGGAEYAITNNITLRAEYLYYDLGSQTVTTAGNAAVLASPYAPVYATVKAQYDGSIFRIGANYKF